MQLRSISSLKLSGLNLDWLLSESAVWLLANCLIIIKIRLRPARYKNMYVVLDIQIPPNACIGPQGSTTLLVSTQTQLLHKDGCVSDRVRHGPDPHLTACKGLKQSGQKLKNGGQVRPQTLISGRTNSSCLVLFSKKHAVQSTGRVGTCLLFNN